MFSIAAVLARAWAFVLPWTGPIVARLTPWLPLFGGVTRWARVASYLAVLGAGGWLSYLVMSWWTADLVSPADARARLAAEQKAEALHAKETALAQRERALSERVRQITTTEQDLAVMAETMEATRAKIPGDDAAVVPADDRWLRAWQGR